MRLTFWNKIYHIGVKAGDNDQLIRQKRMNNQVTLFTTLSTAFFIPYLCAVGNYHFVPFECAATFLVTCCFVLNYYGLLRLAMLWRFAIVLLIVTFGSLEMTSAGFEYFLVPLAVSPLILSDSTKEQLLLFSISLIFFFLIKYVSRDYKYHFLLTKEQEYFTFTVVLTMVFVLCALFVIKFKVAATKYQEVIRKQLAEIGEQKKDILSSIAYAQRIQEALLPPESELRKLIKDYFVFYRPKDIVSGDFYWLERSGNKVFISVADCTGHGVPGAMMSVLCINALTRVVKEMSIEKPSLILDKVAVLMEEQLSKTGNNVMDGMDIALCCLDTENGSVEFAGAYNSLYVISDGMLTEVKADRQPIGKTEYRRPFTNHVIKYNKGDCFYVHSDGLCDQFGGHNGKKFGAKQLREVLVANHSKSLEEQHSLMNKSFEDWKGSADQIDDVCILGFRV